MHGTVRIGLFPLVILTVTACSGDALGPIYREVIATIAYEDSPAIIGPEIEIQVDGRVVHVTVGTFDSSCYQMGHPSIEVEGESATVTPYNLAPPPGFDCDRIQAYHRHSATIEFTGDHETARILIRGFFIPMLSGKQELMEVGRVVELGNE